MAKITRKTQKVFAQNATNNGQFGSAQAGTKVTSTDLDTLQSLSAFLSGWEDAVASGRLPALEEMQALHYITTSQIGYLLQEGIPEYDSATEYHQNSIVKKVGTYELYGSKIDTNTGNSLPNQVDDANWEYLGNLKSRERVSNTQVFDGAVDGNMPTGSYANLDLSSVVGSNIARVVIKIVPDTLCAIHIRADGSTETAPYENDASRGGGLSYGSCDNNNTLVLSCLTSSSGVIEWRSNAAGSGGATVEVETYTVL